MYADATLLPLLLFAALSSNLYPPPPQYPPQQPCSISVQICLSPLKRHLLYGLREGSGVAPLLSWCYNEDDALSASAELASLLPILFFQRAALQCKKEDVVDLKMKCNEWLLLCTLRTEISRGRHKTSSCLRRRSHKRKTQHFTGN